MMDYLRDPTAIYARSFAIIRAEADLSGLPPDSASRRHPHDPCLRHDRIVARSAHFGGFRRGRPRRARAGTPIFCDSEMVRPASSPNASTVDLHAQRSRARANSASPARPRARPPPSICGQPFRRAVVVIGNAPTALFALLELLDAGAPKPAAIIAASPSASSAPRKRKPSSPTNPAASPSSRCSAAAAAPPWPPPSSTRYRQGIA